MNFTYYYFCECEYQYNQAVHVLENQKIYQCFHCSNLEAHKSQDLYQLKCQLCGEKEMLGNTAAFGKEILCKGCAVKGKVGVENEEQFVLLVDASVEKPCSKCQRIKWVQAPSVICCPYCQSQLKVKMSDFWEK